MKTLLKYFFKHEFYEQKLNGLQFHIRYINEKDEPKTLDFVNNQILNDRNTLARFQQLGIDPSKFLNNTKDELVALTIRARDFKTWSPINESKKQIVSASDMLDIYKMESVEISQVLTRLLYSAFDISSFLAVYIEFAVYINDKRYYLSELIQDLLEEKYQIYSEDEIEQNFEKLLKLGLVYFNSQVDIDNLTIKQKSSVILAEMLNNRSEVEINLVLEYSDLNNYDNLQKIIDKFHNIYLILNSYQLNNRLLEINRISSDSINGMILNSLKNKLSKYSWDKTIYYNGFVDPEQNETREIRIEKLCNAIINNKDIVFKDLLNRKMNQNNSISIADSILVFNNLHIEALSINNLDLSQHNLFDTSLFQLTKSNIYFIILSLYNNTTKKSNYKIFSSHGNTDVVIDEVFKYLVYNKDKI